MRCFFVSFFAEALPPMRPILLSALRVASSMFAPFLPVSLPVSLNTKLTCKLNQEDSERERRIITGQPFGARATRPGADLPSQPGRIFRVGYRAADQRRQRGSRDEAKFSVGSTTLPTLPSP